LTVVGANIKTLQVQNDQVRKHWLGSYLNCYLIHFMHVSTNVETKIYIWLKIKERTTRKALCETLLIYLKIGGL
jgi:hypothetical protein